MDIINFDVGTFPVQSINVSSRSLRNEPVKKKNDIWLGVFQPLTNRISIVLGCIEATFSAGYILTSTYLL